LTSYSVFTASPTNSRILSDNTEFYTTSGGPSKASITDARAAFTVPIQFSAYTRSQAATLTGSLGQQICISDSSGSSTQSIDGLMAFWDMTNTRWSYIHDNRAV